MASDTFEDTFEEGSGMSTEDSGGMSVDLSGTDENAQVEAMPRGIYPVVLDQLDYGQSQRSGNNMWTWIWEVSDGEYAGRKLWLHTTFTEAGLPRVKRTLARIKTDDGYEAQLLTSRFNPENVANEGRLLGARCRLRVDIRVYQGRKTNNVRDVLAVTGEGSDGFGGV